MNGIKNSASIFSSTYESSSRSISVLFFSDTRERIVLDGREEPQRFKCPNCRKNVRTNVRKEASNLQCYCSAMCCLMGLWPCILLAWFTDCLYDKIHSCPNCNIDFEIDD